MSLLVELHIIPWLLQYEISKIENLLDDLDGIVVCLFCIFTLKLSILEKVYWHKYY